MFLFGKKLKGVMFAVIFSLGSIPVSATYIGYDTWYDANKSPYNSEDDLMCWAAAASNILYWGNWNTPAYPSEDTVWKHFQDHWTDKGSIMEFGWDWWLN